MIDRFMITYKSLLNTYTLEEILELCDIDQEELIDHLIDIGWIDIDSIPTEVDLSAN